MLNQILLLTGAFLPFAWGAAHLIPTKSVVAGFGDITLDNRRIITMEWITEGVALVFLGALVAVVSLIDTGGGATLAVYVLSAATLVVLAVVSLFTGFRISFLPFRLCPVVLGTSAALILAGALI